MKSKHIFLHGECATALRKLFRRSRYTRDVEILHQGEVWYEECVTFYSTWPIWFRDLIWSVYFTSRQNLIQSLQGSVSEYRTLTADEIRRFLIRKDVTHVGLRGITVSRRWPRANETLMKCTNWRRRLPITSHSVNQLTNIAGTFPYTIYTAWRNSVRNK